MSLRQRSHLGNGANADAVDEGTLENLAFLHKGGHTQNDVNVEISI